MILKPLENITSENLLERLIDGHTFERMPVDAIYACLSRAQAVLQLVMADAEESRVVNALWSVEHEIADAVTMFHAVALPKPEVQP